jgi:hypothetical protein
VLGRSVRAGPPQHQTIRATIDWSCELANSGMNRSEFIANQVPHFTTRKFLTQAQLARQMGIGLVPGRMELQCCDKASVVDRELLGNGRAHGLTRQVRASDPERAQNRGSIVAHLPDRVPIFWDVRGANAAIIKQ